MNVYDVSLSNATDKYKNVYVRAGSFAEAVAKVEAKFPDYKVNGVDIEGEFLD